MHETSNSIEAFGAYQAALILTSKPADSEELDLKAPFGRSPVPSHSAQTLTGSVETSPLRIEDEDSDPERAFEKLDEKWNTEFGELLEYIRTSLERPDRDRLACRLEYLATPLEDEADFVPVSPMSLRGFLSLLVSFPRLRYPDIGITPTGNLRVHWRASRERYAAMEFVPSGDVRFVLLFPNPKRHGRLVREYGITTADYLLARHELRWIGK